MGESLTMETQWEISWNNPFLPNRGLRIQQHGIKIVQRSRNDMATHQTKSWFGIGSIQELGYQKCGGFQYQQGWGYSGRAKNQLPKMIWGIQKKMLQKQDYGFRVNQWPFQVPKLEVGYNITPCLYVPSHSPYIDLIYGPPIQVPEMASDSMALHLRWIWGIKST